MEMTDSFKQVFRDIVREEVVREVRPLRTDIEELKVVVGSHDLQLRQIHTDTRGIKAGLRYQTAELQRTNVLLEDLTYRFEAGQELGNA